MGLKKKKQVPASQLWIPSCRFPPPPLQLKHPPVLPHFATASSSAAVKPTAAAVAAAATLAGAVRGWEQDLQLAFALRHFHRGNRSCRHGFPTLHGRRNESTPAHRGGGRRPVRAALVPQPGRPKGNTNVINPLSQRDDPQQQPGRKLFRKGKSERRRQRAPGRRHTHKKTQKRVFFSMAGGEELAHSDAGEEGGRGRRRSRARPSSPGRVNKCLGGRRASRRSPREEVRAAALLRPCPEEDAPAQGDREGEAQGGSPVLLQPTNPEVAGSCPHPQDTSSAFVFPPQPTPARQGSPFLTPTREIHPAGRARPARPRCLSPTQQQQQKQQHSKQQVATPSGLALTPPHRLVRLRKGSGAGAAMFVKGRVGDCSGGKKQARARK